MQYYEYYECNMRALREGVTFFGMLFFLEEGMEVAILVCIVMHGF